ncbi:MAG: GlxA family transcriptional regulator [Alphaproteobacteria bacterium]|nr:GlxA family transcriptional regulator [Alphaproteobacteria bacterium]
MPNWNKSAGKCRRIDILLFDRFSNHCLANTVEPLRAANELAPGNLYRWRYLTLDGASVTSSSGLLVEPDGALRDGLGGEFLFVLPSYGFRQLATPVCLTALRSAATRYAVMAGLDTGGWLLAEAGLLTGRRATVHWHELDGFAERFPDVEVVRERFVIDADRITCGGAMAAFDLVSRLVAIQHGEALRLEVALMFMHEGTVVQGRELAAPKSGAVQRAITLMRENLEEPLSVVTLAKRVGQTQRRLEQGFRRELGATPRTVYRRLRLLSARKMVDETDLPVAEIAVRSGYANPAAMTRAFSGEFGMTPRAIRSGTDQ